MDLLANVYAPVGIAALTSGALRVAARWRAWPGLAAVPLALLAGAVTLGLPINLKAIAGPRVLADYLLLVALAGCGLMVLSSRFRGRLLLNGLAVLTGWWIAHAPPALPEFWRAGLVLTLYTLLLIRRPADAVFVAAVAGAAAMAMTREAIWSIPALVAAAAVAPVLGSGVSAAPAAAFLAAVMGLACLAGGRAMAGQAGPVELAALAPVAAAYLWPPISPSFRRPRPGKRAGRRDARVAVRRRRP